MCYRDTLQTEQEAFANGVRQVMLASDSTKIKIVAGEQICVESRFFFYGKWYNDSYEAKNSVCLEDKFYSFTGKNELGCFTLSLFRKTDCSWFMSKTYFVWNERPSPYVDSKTFYKKLEKEQAEKALSLSVNRKRKARQSFDAGDFSSHRAQSKRISSSPVVDGGVLARRMQSAVP